MLNTAKHLPFSVVYPQSLILNVLIFFSHLSRVIWWFYKNYLLFCIFVLLENWLFTLVLTTELQFIIADFYFSQVHQRLPWNGLKQQVNSTKLFMPGFLFFHSLTLRLCVYLRDYKSLSDNVICLAFVSVVSVFWKKTLTHTKSHDRTVSLSRAASLHFCWPRTWLFMSLFAFSCFAHTCVIVIHKKCDTMYVFDYRRRWLPLEKVTHRCKTRTWFLEFSNWNADFLFFRQETHALGYK